MSFAHYTCPSEWVFGVLNVLQRRLGIEITSVYQREAQEIDRAKVCYLVGEVDPSPYANDGRKVHDIELRFLCYAPLGLTNFELEALNLSCRLMRELQDESFNGGAIHEPMRVVSNLPTKFSPDDGFFLRTVTVKQKISLGRLDEEQNSIVGSCMHADEVNWPH